jgi:hypothetical protein
MERTLQVQVLTTRTRQAQNLQLKIQQQCWRMAVQKPDPKTLQFFHALNTKPMAKKKKEEEVPVHPVHEYVEPHVPGTKEVYAYNEEGVFVGIAVSHESPLEKGVWHMPARTTDIEPMTPVGCIAIFKSGKWGYLPIEKSE